MNLKRTVLVLLCAASASGVLAQDAPPAASESKAPPPAAKAPAPTASTPSDTAAKPKDAKEPAATASPAGKPTKDSAGTPQRFVPTEQVRSDFDVSFPVDI